MEAFRAVERGLDSGGVVAVDRTDVLQPEVLEHALRGEGVLEPLLGPVQRLVQRLPDDGCLLQDALAPGEEPFVAVGGAQGREVVGEAADGRGVGALVVVDDDDQGAVLGGGDVVQRLPGHAAGEGSVTDDRDHMAGAAEDLVGLGEAVGPAEDGGGVRVLDDVVLGLGTRGVAGEAALAAQFGEVLPPGEELVYVALMAGVPQNPVHGRVEDPVQGDGELHHPEVGAQVATGPGHRLDEELPDVLGEFTELRFVQCLEIARPPDGLQQRHARAPSLVLFSAHGDGGDPRWCAHVVHALGGLSPAGRRRPGLDAPRGAAHRERPGRRLGETQCDWLSGGHHVTGSRRWSPVRHAGIP